MENITAQQVQDALAAGEQLNIIDVREDFEVAYGMIPGAIHIPLGELEYRMSELDERKPYIFVCKAGVRSYNAAMFMESVGFETLNLSDGMMSWQGDVER
jgi:rhodanese-related sulfurtransferase